MTERSSTGTEAVRQCTCHPSDNPPVPCAKKYALSECRAHERFREFADIVWQHATEGASFPSTVTRDMLIERWGGVVPAQQTPDYALGKRAAEFIGNIDPFGDHFSEHDLRTLAGQKWNIATEGYADIARQTTEPGSYPEALRLIRKYRTDPKEGIGNLFVKVAQALEEAERPRRNDLAKMLNAWSFWRELGAELQSELLDCIEHTYGHGTTAFSSTKCGTKP
jgi:hypothetical protein